MILIRPTIESDADHLNRWLMKGDVLDWFPMENQLEIEDATRIWMSYAGLGASLTATLNDEPVGMAMLYIQPFKKLAHQCLFTIVISPDYRSQGIGTQLMKALMKLGKEKFHLEMLHLEVYDGNPAIGLYRKLGFTEFGKQAHFIKEGENRYRGKTMMQKIL
jgi:ribosomal protein S18 acetylase RimI-like enzyme